MKTSKMFGQMVSSSETLSAFSLAVFTWTVDVCDVVLGLVMSCHISLAAEEFCWLSIFATAIFMGAVCTTIADGSGNMLVKRFS